MSDQVETEADEAVVPAGPSVSLIPAPTGGLFGLMHLDDKVRAFWGDSEERVRALVSKVAIAEFGLPQDQADSLASMGVWAHQDAGAQLADLQSQLEASQARCAELEAQVEQLTRPAAETGPQPNSSEDTSGQDDQSGSQDDQGSAAASVGGAGNPGPQPEA